MFLGCGTSYYYSVGWFCDVHPAVWGGKMIDRKKVNINIKIIVGQIDYQETFLN